MEGLNLDAGRLGPVLLFNLSAQGVGYTSAVKVRVASFVQNRHLKGQKQNAVCAGGALCRC